jgi:choline dehydrogenase
MVDYVVIGAGAAGCVLARRLVDAGSSVCLIEAGELRAHASNVDEIGGFTNLWGSQYDWALPTVPQDGLSGRQITINQGRIVGGSSAINAMMYVRCNRSDYALLSERTGGRWSDRDIETALAAIENYQDGAAPGRYQGGMMSVRNCPDASAYSPEFQLAAKELGYKGDDWDYNGPEQKDGAGPLQFNIGLDGHRHSAFNAYLQPILSSPLLTVLSGTTVERIAFKGTRAVSVETIDAGGTRKSVTFEKDAIVSSGALQSPALLLKSGIGPAAQLKAAGIAVVADIAAVGENLMDHLQLPIIYRLQKPLPEPTLLTGNVLFTDVNHHGVGGAPDLQLNFTPAAPKPLQRMLPPLGGPVMIFLPIMVQPKSRGTIALRADGSVAIDPRYLSNPSDVELLKKAVELVRSMAHSKAMSGLAGDELAPGGLDAETYIRAGASTLWHPVGTCSIGSDTADSVVDADLRVHGIEGLRVCDASVIPRATSGNTHVPTMVVAELGARRMLNAAH